MKNKKETFEEYKARLREARDYYKYGKPKKRKDKKCQSMK